MIVRKMVVIVLAALSAAGWTASPRATQGRAAPSPVTVTRVASPEKALRFEVTVPAGLDDVWTAFTTASGLVTWLWRDTRLDLRVGGDWLALFPTSTGGGTIQSFTPKSQLVLAALAPDQFPTVRATRTRAVFDFASVGPAATRVTLTQTGWKTGKEWDDAYEYLASGNAELLDQLRQRFVSGPIAWPKGGGRRPPR
jgi:uncharacterized protein YndB with AHSA1/START domain